MICDQAAWHTSTSTIQQWQKPSWKPLIATCSHSSMILSSSRLIMAWMSTNERQKRCWSAPSWKTSHRSWHSTGLWVTTFKLLGVYISRNLKWTQHVDAISSKVSRSLKVSSCLDSTFWNGSSAPVCPLTTYCVSTQQWCAHCMLEYACPVWHSSLTVGQHEALESLQKQAMRIIFNHDDYLTALIIAGIDNLQARREHLTEQCFLRHVLKE